MINSYGVMFECINKNAAMKGFPLHRRKMPTDPPKISLGQKYLTTSNPIGPNYNTPDQHHDLKKLTAPNNRPSVQHHKLECGFRRSPWTRTHTPETQEDHQ